MLRSVQLTLACWFLRSHGKRRKNSDEIFSALVSPNPNPNPNPNLTLTLTLTLT